MENSHTSSSQSPDNTSDASNSSHTAQSESNNNAASESQPLNAQNNKENDPADNDDASLNEGQQEGPQTKAFNTAREENSDKNGQEEQADTKSDEHLKNGEEKSEKKDSNEEDAGGKPMSLFEHLNELRSRLIKITLAAICGFGICWFYVDPLFNILVQPLLQVLPAGAHAQYTTLPEAFFIRMQVAFVAGLFVASPIIFYQIWAFIAPGLYEEEKKYIIPIAILSALFFAGGACFCYFIVFPFAFNFFISYSTPEILITPKISDYISFVLKLLCAFGLIFEMPIFTLFLARLGLVSARIMRKGRKYAIVVIFIIAAVLTPPDVLSQLLMACPMLALYEISIGVAAIFGKKSRKGESEEA